MKNKTVAVMILLALTIYSVHTQATFTDVRAYDGYRVHNLNTNLDYPTIQEAIDANQTLNGQTIFVESGTYYEHVVVSKSISIIGENKDATIIDGNGTEYGLGRDSVVYVTADNVLFSRCKVRRSGGNSYWDLAGAICLASNNSTVSGNIVESNYRGIIVGDPYLRSVANNTVIGNIVQNNNYGIFGYILSNSTVSDNTISKNTYGIYFMGWSSHNYVHDNVVVENDYGIILSAPVVIGGASQHITEGNLSAENPYRTYAEENPFLEYNNSICRNDFVNNTIQASVGDFYSELDSWDNGSEGNYWSDYKTKYPNATEMDSSGVWNAPYSIDTNNTDRYPLVNPVIPEFPSPTVLLACTLACFAVTIALHRKHLKLTGKERTP